MENPRILLVNPPFYRLHKNDYTMSKLPLGLAYLAGCILEQTDWDVKIYNADFHPRNTENKLKYLAGKGHENFKRNIEHPVGGVWDETRAMLESFNADVIGLQVTSQTMASAVVVARMAREINPQVTIVMGGPHPSMAGERLFSHPEVDISVLQEGELTLVELLQTIKAGGDLCNVAGIIYRDGERVVANLPRPYLEDLDTLPLPNEIAPQVLIDHDLYPKAAFMNIFASRGCPFSCIFCGSREIWTRRVRFRSPQNILQELEGLKAIGLQRFVFSDDTIGINHKFLASFCELMIAKDMQMNWRCEMRADEINPQILALMKRAGCTTIAVGVESGNDRVLQDMRKEITVAQAVMACEMVRHAGLELETFILVGFPTETKESMRDTLRVMKQVNANQYIYSIYTPYPYTEAFDLVHSMGLISLDHDLSLHNHQSPLNTFVADMSPQEFRREARRIERFVDRRNQWHRVKSIFTPKLGKRVAELGVRASFAKALRLFLPNS